MRGIGRDCLGHQLSTHHSQLITALLMAERVGVRSPTRLVPGSQCQLALPLGGQPLSGSSSARRRSDDPYSPPHPTGQAILARTGLWPFFISTRCRGATPFPVISCRDLLVLWRVTGHRLVNYGFYRAKLWRRGRAFEVALRCFARAPARGSTPSRLRFAPVTP